MSDIWAGEVGPTHWLCPYHMILWHDEDEYLNHMAVFHDSIGDSKPMRIVSVDKQSGVVTLVTEREGDKNGS